MNNCTKGKIRRSIVHAFLQTNKGRSSDDVIIDDLLNVEFIRLAKKLLPDCSPTDINWQLLNLRKAGKLGSVSKHRVLLKNQEDYIHASEIAARFMEDKYSINIDRVICNPDLRSEFDRLAESIAPGYTKYEYRKAALKLRKTGQLKPELLRFVMQSGRQITFTNVEEILENPEKIPRLPGIYIFINSTGVLYIGETQYLRIRVLKHLDHSDRKSLAYYFWQNGMRKIKVEIICFQKDTLGAKPKIRKSLEASLITSRRPRFNINHS